MPAVPRSCAGCGAELDGRFCAACGEEVLTAEARTVRHFLTTSVLDEVVQFDSRFWRTMRALLFQPGRLTREHIAGNRRAYVGPVKLLLASILAFVVATRGGFVATLMLGPIVLSIAPTAPPPGLTLRETMVYVDRFGLLDSELNARLQRGGGPTAAAQIAFRDRIRGVVQPLSFGNVFFLGLGLYLLFRRRFPFYVDHLIFSVHAISFVLWSSLLLLPAYWYEDANRPAALAAILSVGIWQFAYLTTAIRRMYFGEIRDRFAARARAFGAAVVVYLLNGVFVTIVQLVAGWLAIREL
jgi:hypothetical protein